MSDAEEIKRLLDDMAADDWPVIFRVLDMLRRAAHAKRDGLIEEFWSDQAKWFNGWQVETILGGSQR